MDEHDSIPRGNTVSMFGKHSTSHHIGPCIIIARPQVTGERAGCIDHSTGSQVRTMQYKGYITSYSMQTLTTEMTLEKSQPSQNDKQHGSIIRSRQYTSTPTRRDKRPYAIATAWLEAGCQQLQMEQRPLTARRMSKMSRLRCIYILLPHDEQKA